MKQTNNKNSNIKVKIACVFFAFFMWMYVMTDSDPIDTREINSANVNITNLSQIQDNNLTLSPNQDIKASAKLKGRRSIISKKIKDGIKLQITIQNPKVGVNTAKVTIAGDNTDINYNITPVSLDVMLEENKVKSEKVHIKSVGSLAQNYYIDTIKLSKDNVYVSGPSSLIEKISKVEAEIDLANNSQDFSKISKFKFLDKDSNEIQGLMSDTPNVVITVKVKKEKIVPIKANIISEGVDYELTEMKIEPESIKIQGTPSNIDSITAIQTKQVNISELFGKPVFEIELDLPKDVFSITKSVSIKSKVDKLNENLEEKEFEYTKEEIEIKNFQSLTEEQVSKINIPDTVKLSFLSNEQQIEKEDISLYIDLSQINNDKIIINHKSQKEIQDVKITPEYVEFIKEKTENN